MEEYQVTKILALDIETIGAIAYTFKSYDASFGVEQVIKSPRVIAVSYQWAHEKKVRFASEYHDGYEEMLRQIHEAIDQADIVIHFNGNRFDMPWLSGEFLRLGWAPPSPFKAIDLYRTIKSKTRFFLGKLDWAIMELLDERKVSHSGFRLWRDCDMGTEDEKRKAWALMKKYAIKDTAVLLPLYERVKPYIPNHPNIALLDGQEAACPACGSDAHIQRRGYAYTDASKFPRYQCYVGTGGCGKWFRSSKRVASTEMRGI